MRAALALLLAAVALGGCGDTPDAPPPETAPVPAVWPVDLRAVEVAFEQCLAGDVASGVARLDSVLAASPGDPDALASRGLCRWTGWGDDGDIEDVRAAYTDLSAAIDAVEGGASSRGLSLDALYSHRAFVARALDDGWVRALEDLDRAVALSPEDPQHVLDRGVALSYTGDSVAARRDLRQYLALADSAEARDDFDADPARRSVVESLLDDLGGQAPLPR